MPRPKKPARLWQRKDGAWIILDGNTQHRTGHSGEGGRRSAENALRDYLATRAPERSGPAQPSEITVGEVLALYAREKGPHVSGRKTLAQSVKALAPFWGGLTCDAVKGTTCRAYVAQAGVAESTSRRRLAVLQAALNYAHAEGALIYAPKVTLPPDGAPRDRWLTRDEAARVLREARRSQNPTLARFILISLATGTRASAVLALQWNPSLDSGWIDLERGIIHRKGARERETKKRRGSVAMTRGLHAHMRRWARAGGSHVIMKGGREIGTIHRAFNGAAERAGIEDVTVHDLKRTAVTWAFQRGMTMEDATDWFATSRVTLEAVYRQFSPHYQARAKAIMEGK